MAKDRWGRRWWEQAEVGLLLVHQEQGPVFANPPMRRHLGLSASETDQSLPLLEELPYWASPQPECFSGRLQLLVVQGDGSGQGGVVLHLPASPQGGAVAAVLYVPQRLTAPWSWLAPQHLRQREQLQRLLGSQLPDVPAIAAGRSAAAQRLRGQLRLALQCQAPLLVCGPRGSGRLALLRWLFARWSGTGDRLLVLDGALLSAELIQSSMSAFLQATSPDCSGTAESRAMVILHQLDRMAPAVQEQLLPQVEATSQWLRWAATVATAAEPRKPSLLQQRLAVLPIQLPPLEKRREDLPEMALALLLELRPRQSLQGFHAEALEVLADYSWPGQWDELHQVVQQAAQAAQGTLITRDDLPRYLRTWEEPAEHPPAPVALEEVLQCVERNLIQEALARCGGNKAQAARLLGLSRPRLYRRLRELGLEGEDSQ